MTREELNKAIYEFGKERLLVEDEQEKTIEGLIAERNQSDDELASIRAVLLEVRAVLNVPDNTRFDLLQRVTELKEKADKYEALVSK